MDEKEWLQNLKAGDRVYLDRGYNGKAIVPVFRVTDKQIVLRLQNGAGNDYELRFWKKGGFEVGGDTWRRTMIRELTPEREANLRLMVKKQKINEMMKNASLPDNETALDKLIAALSEFVK